MTERRSGPGKFGGQNRGRSGRPERRDGNKAPKEENGKRPGFAGKSGHGGTRGTAQGRDRNGGARPARPISRIVPRRVALDVLLEVTQKDAYAQLALDKRLAQVTLDRRDAAFVTRLVYGTIENRLSLDYRIDTYLTQSEALEPTVREILRMGAYQLFYLDRVPDMAAVDESVTLTRTMGMEGLTGLVNAVLRNMIRGRDTFAFPKPEEDEIRYLSVVFSAPEELCRLLAEAYGPRRAMEILRLRRREPVQSIRVNRLRCDDARLRHLLSDDGLEFTPGLADGTYRVRGGGDLTKLRAYQNGLFCIQGESSVLAARALGARPGQSVLDACAAPGGKTAVLSEMMNDTGRVYAWDTHAHRVDLIRGMINRLKLENVRPAVRDARQPREEMAGTLDGVLIDAPCTGTGVILEKPDLKYRVTEAGLSELADTQREILEAIAPMVKPGGTLVYSTCSILPQENREQIRAFLERHPEYTMQPLGDELPEALRAREDAFGVQLFQDLDGLDGFFIARLKRERR